MTNEHYISLPSKDGLVDQNLVSDPSISVYRWGCGDLHGLEIEFYGSKIGYISEGTAELSVFGDIQETYSLKRGMYFLCPHKGRITGGSGFLVNCETYIGMFMIGGPIENIGRLRYIDGCTDTLLIPPDKKGNPCLNLLCFPAGISQTRHTHPSLRIGIVARGRGKCVIPSMEEPCKQDLDEEIELSVGVMFIIPPGGQHSFFTDSETMDIIAFHPDTDTGPENENHPMINRTIVNGVSASKIANIWTKHD